MSLSVQSARMKDLPERAPDAVAPPPGHPRFPLFDSLRAIAAIFVVMVHTSFFTGPLQSDHWWRGLIAHLDIGVTIFFLLSGFLLYRPFVASRQLGSPAIKVPGYVWRRFLRIAPAYWAALTILTIIPGLYGAFSGNWWVYYGLLQNYPVYTRTGGCATDLFRCGIAPTWSLGIEVGFYVLLPFFALGMANISSRLRSKLWFSAELTALLALTIVSFFIQYHPWLGDSYTWLFFSPIGRGWWFALGMGLAVVSVRVSERQSEPRLVRWLGDHPLACWGGALGIYAVCSLVLIDPTPTVAGQVVATSQYMEQFFLFGVIALLFVIPAAFGGERGGLPRRILAHPVLAWLGLVSYGIFLWHFPILVGLLDWGVVDWWPAHAFIFTVVSTMAITICCAAASYYVVERPLMRLKNRRTSKSMRVGTGAREAGSSSA